MPTLFQWHLTVRRGLPLGIGIVSGHPKLAEGLNAHTSPVMRAAAAEESLRLETASGSVYHLPMREWRPGEQDLPALKQLGLPPDFGARCAQIREEASRMEKSGLRPFMKPGTLFLRIVGTRILSALWSGADSRLRDAAVEIHLGMFQDSYLIHGAYEGSSALCRVDLRLFPMSNRLEPYRVSRGISSLLVCNEGRTNIAFGSAAESTLCPSGAITPVSVHGG